MDHQINQTNPFEKIIRKNGIMLYCFDVNKQWIDQPKQSIHIRNNIWCGYIKILRKISIITSEKIHNPEIIHINNPPMMINHEITSEKIHIFPCVFLAQDFSPKVTQMDPERVTGRFARTEHTRHPTSPKVGAIGEDLKTWKKTWVIWVWIEFW